MASERISLSLSEGSKHSIVASQQEVNDRACHRDVKPNWKNDAGKLSMSVKLIGKSINEG